MGVSCSLKLDPSFVKRTVRLALELAAPSIEAYVFCGDVADIAYCLFRQYTTRRAYINLVYANLRFLSLILTQAVIFCFF